MKDRLYRSRKKRVIGGVCAGLADYFNIDPIIVRILMVVLTIANGVGLLLYIILWIVVPEADIEEGATVKQESQPSDKEEVKNEEPLTTEGKPVTVKNSSGAGRIVFGVILIMLGFLFLLDRYFPYFDFEDIFPVTLVLLGIALVVNSFRK